MKYIIYGLAAGLARGMAAGPAVVLAAGPVILDPAVMLDPAGLAGFFNTVPLANCCNGSKLVEIAANSILAPNTIEIAYCFSI
jgi:hypothetical protein